MAQSHSNYRERYKKLGKFTLSPLHIGGFKSIFQSDENADYAAQLLEAEYKKFQQNDDMANIIFLDEEEKLSAVEEVKELQTKLPKLIDGFAQQGIVNNATETCAVAIFANQRGVGGNPWPDSVRAQEESILLHSTARIYMPEKYFLNNNDRDTIERSLGFAPLGGGYAINNITLLGDGKKLIVAESAPRKHFSAIFIAAPDFRSGGDYYYKDNNYLIEMANIIRTQYRLALKSNAKKLIAGALGCGAFGNNPYLVAYLQILILQEPEFAELDVEFYIPKGNDQNYEAFASILQNFNTLSKREQSQPIKEIISRANSKKILPYSELDKQFHPTEINTHLRIQKWATLIKNEPINLMSFDDPTIPVKIIFNNGSGFLFNDDMLKSGRLKEVFKDMIFKNEEAAKIMKYIIHRASTPDEYYHWYSRPLAFFTCGHGPVSRTDRLNDAFAAFKIANGDAAPLAKETNLADIKSECEHWEQVKPRKP